MKIWKILLLFFIGHNLAAQHKEVCITVDDLPVVGYGNHDIDYQRQIVDGLLSHFEKYGIPAIGYVNEVKLYDQGHLDTARVALLEEWLKRGFELGNHTYSHINYHKTDLKTYTEDILKGGQVTGPLMRKYNKALIYFRHPFLKLGDSKEKADSLSSFLHDNNYVAAPVTFDNEDYLFAEAYAKAFESNDTLKMRGIGEKYIKYSKDKLMYQENMVKQLFDGPIRHIALIHVNLLNAHYLGGLIEIYQSNGYTFISQKEALTDKVYDLGIKRFGDYGISWIDRWALSKSKKAGFFKGAPTMPDLQ